MSIYSTFSGVRLTGDDAEAFLKMLKSDDHDYRCVEESLKRGRKIIEKMNESS